MSGKRTIFIADSSYKRIVGGVSENGVINTFDTKRENTVVGWSNDEWKEGFEERKVQMLSPNDEWNDMGWESRNGRPRDLRMRFEY